jgi:hypothetical protein
MTGSAKQSIVLRNGKLDCFVASAFRLRSASFGGRGRSLSYGGQVASRNDVETRLCDLAAYPREFCQKVLPSKIRGRREYRALDAPAASHAK